MELKKSIGRYCTERAVKSPGCYGREGKAQVPVFGHLEGNMSYFILTKIQMKKKAINVCINAKNEETWDMWCSRKLFLFTKDIAKKFITNSY